MAHVVTKNCMGSLDKACVQVCPVDAFYWIQKKELNDKYNKPPARGSDWGMLMIDPDSCIDCDACTTECPTQAIYADSDVPDDLNEFIQLNADEISALSDDEKEAAHCTAK